MAYKWRNEDGVALRAFFNKVPKAVFKELMDELCPATIDADDLKNLSAESIARISSMKAGWDAYQKVLFGLAEQSSSSPPDPDFADMK